MSEDPNRKSLRQFQSRDYLWTIFEQMSQELDCSVDYLVNEAMKHYARAQGRIQGPGPTMAGGRPPGANPMPRMGSSMGGARPGMPGPRPGMPGPNGAMAYPGARPARPGFPPSPAAPRMPPPQVPVASVAPPPGAMLYALYEGQKYPVNKDEFYIGRSNKSCDLIVKDPNVSRQHARIVRHQGQYWMVDMGSTNGIEFQGQRVDRRPIGEGDVFRICDHDVIFTYR
ncbi:MAG: FHA domain-containing protein [Polyangiales bacterium]